MKISPGKIIQSRFLLAVVAGLLLASSFPKIGMAGFAWIAPGLMLAAALGRRGAESFRIGYVAGLAHYLTSLYWLLLIPYRWHGLPLGPALGWLALSAYLSLFPAAWVWMAMKVLSFKFQVSSGRTADETWLALFQKLAAASWPHRLRWTLCCAASWVAMEMILVRFLGGFPWNLLGTSQFQIVPLIQIASLTGVYGVGFVLVWTSASLLCAIAAILARPTMRSAWLGELILPMLALTTAFVWGFQKLPHPSELKRELKVTLIQPSIPQTLIWDPENDTARFHDLLRLSNEALTNKTDLLLWPEAAIPKMLRYHEEIFHAVTNLAYQHHVWMMVGSDDEEPRAGSSNPDESDYFNAAFLIGPHGELMDRYCKRNLVIFGEYIPLARWLPFLKWFTPIDAGFTPGRSAGKFSLSDLKIKLAPLICYEDTFPQLGREGAEGDTDFLVNLTNDGWFGEGAAQWQQAAGAVFRAVENGVPLVRCANSGLTCWIDEAGNIRALFTDKNGSVYGAGFITMNIPLAEKRSPTFYNQHGDWFGWGCVMWTALIVSRRLFPRVAEP